MSYTTPTTETNLPPTVTGTEGTDVANVDSGPLASEHGVTTIADTVVEKIAGVATREVPGVHRLGSGAARALGTLRERIPGQKTDPSQGVTVEVGQRQAAVDLVLVVDYGVSIVDVADAVRENVSSSIWSMTGLEVTEVNIAVDDVHLPDEADDDDDDGGARVQ